jgi:RNA polymerase sigma-70 factor (sigma-E family)
MPEMTFADFVGESLPMLTRYAYALTGERHAAEDLVQDSLVKLSGAWRRVRHDGNPIGYARTVMFRTYVSRWRVRSRRPALHEYREQPAPDDPYTQVEVRDALRRALADLPRLQRAVLVLGYLDDLPDGEIAVLLERRPATIRSLRHRGLLTLRQRLEPHDVKKVTHGTC